MEISVKGLTKIYNGIKVLDNLSFDIPKNSVTGFLGVNGAGKTTTFKLLTGIIEKDGGTITIAGNNINAKNLAKELRYLEDVPEFYNYMTSYEYLKFICELNNITNYNEEIKETLKLVGLEDSINKKIGRFSRGMKQRIGIASSIISKPKILLLDEPISALDPVGRQEIFDLINKLKGKMTIMFSTHILDDIERVCDRIILINKGKKIIDGEISDIKSKYLQDVLLISFINKIDMNLFLSTIKDKYIIQKENLTIKIKTNNLIEAEKDIFKILNKEKMYINSLSIVTPSLEEIFISEVNK